MLGKQHSFSCKNYVEIGAIELGSVQSQFCLFNQFLISMQVNLMQYAWGCLLLYFITAAENLKQLVFHDSLCFFLCSVHYHGTALIILYVKAHQICILVCQAKISYELYELNCYVRVSWFYNILLFKDQLIDYWYALGLKQTLWLLVSSYEFVQTLLNIGVLVVKVIWRNCDIV